MELRGYRMISQLGERTWRARRLSDQALVAVKFLAGADASVLRERVGKENASGAEASGVVKVERVEGVPGGAAVVTPFVEGEALSRALERGVRMELSRAVSIARSVAEGLASAAARGMVHGALRPARIIVRGDEAFVLGLGMGEPRADGPHVYAAPEVLSGKPFDQRADIYSLGAVLFHMLTGHMPFPEYSLGALKLAKTAEFRWPRGSEENIPTRVLRLVERMMAPEADERHRDYDELLVGLEAATLRRRRSRRYAALEEEEEPRPRLRGVLIGAAMVALAGALGMKTLFPARKVKEKGPQLPSPVPAEPARPTVEDEARAAMKELDACAQALDAESAELLIPRLERLAERQDDIGVKAELLLARARRVGEREEMPEPELARRPEPPRPEETIRREETVDARRRLDAAAVAALELIKLDPSRAREFFEKATAGIEFGEHEEEAERIRAVIALAEEAHAEEKLKRKEEERLARLRERLPRVVTRAANLAGAFRYADATAALRGFLKENPPPGDAGLLKAYAGLIEREKKFFREVGRRYETGSQSAMIFFPSNGEKLHVRGVGQDGVLGVSDELSRMGLKELRLPLMHIVPEQIFKLFVMAADKTRAEERLSLAVFAFHRGLAIERENELTVAPALEDGFREKVEQARAVLDRVNELRSARRVRSE